MTETMVLEPEVETQIAPAITAVQIVDRMLEILAEPEHWCKSASAQTRHLIGVPENDPLAVRFCVGAALQKVTGDFGLTCFDPAPATVSLAMTDVSRRRRSVMESDYTYFNDHKDTTHADVLSMLGEVREVVR